MTQPNLKPDEIEMLQRAEKATKGPWYALEWGDDERMTVETKGDGPRICSINDMEEKCGHPLRETADFIAASRTDLPTILTRLANERAKLAIAMEALGKANAGDYGDDLEIFARKILARINELEKQS